MNILIVEDEIDLAKEIAEYLSDKNCICHLAPSYSLAENMLKDRLFEVVLIDLKLSDGNGLNLIKQIKKKKIKSGLIVLSANDELEIRLASLDAGADDYLIKPFHLSELNARIKALIRRKERGGDDIIEYNEISINIPKQEVRIKGQPLSLTAKEYELLLYFVANKNKVITKEAIGYSIWNKHADMDISNEIIYTHVKNLRKKLLTLGCQDYIQSVYGIGYKFNE